jgi:hypothetical protein
MAFAFLSGKNGTGFSTAASIDQARNSKLEVAAIAILGPQLHS